MSFLELLFYPLPKFFGRSLDQVRESIAFKPSILIKFLELITQIAEFLPPSSAASLALCSRFALDILGHGTRRLSRKKIRHMNEKLSYCSWRRICQTTHTAIPARSLIQAKNLIAITIWPLWRHGLSRNSKACCTSSSIKTSTSVSFTRRWSIIAWDSTRNIIVPFGTQDDESTRMFQFQCITEPRNVAGSLLLRSSKWVFPSDLLFTPDRVDGLFKLLN